MGRLRLEHVAKHYGEHDVLRDVTLDLQAGDLVLLRGDSGAGKTTLLQVMGLLEPPVEGRVLLDDEDVGRLPGEQRARLRLTRLGHVFQTHNMIPSLTLLENVLLPMRLAKRADPTRARDLLKSLGLDAQVDKHPHQVSVGQRQRAALARALANEPDVVLADEPTASLDDANAALVAEALRGWCEERDALVVAASHDPRLRSVWRKGTRQLREIDVEEGRVSEAARAEQQGY